MATTEGHLADRLEACLGQRPEAFFPVEGGHTPAGRSRVRLEGGRTVFAKWAVDADTEGWLRAEWNVYRQLQAPFVARALAWDEAGGPRPLLVLEDLTSGLWPPPWTPELARRGLEVLEQVAATTPPRGVGILADLGEELRGWHRVAREPEPFLGLGLVSRGWLERGLETLLAAEAAAPLDGNQLLHLDARGDNMAFLAQRVVLVDWNWACRGAAELDREYFGLHVAATAGPAPEDLGLSGTYAALLAGFFAHQASLPPLPKAPTVRETQRTHLRAALPWAARVLGLPEVDGRGG